MDPRVLVAAGLLAGPVGLAAALDPGPLPAPVCAWTLLCRDDGYGHLNSQCDNSTGWVVYDAFLTPGGAGSAVVKAIDHGPLQGETCGGGWGPTRDWEIEFSIYPVLPGMAVRGAAEGCLASVWANHSNGYCPNPFTALDTYGIFTARGRGVLYQAELDNGLWMDLFLGNGARVSYRPLP